VLAHERAGGSIERQRPRPAECNPGGRRGRSFRARRASGGTTLGKQLRERCERVGRAMMVGWMQVGDG
jgi:hypothetical protein